jgi:hypothetical protein
LKMKIYLIHVRDLFGACVLIVGETVYTVTVLTS